MKFISLFGGIGGFDLALTRLGWECVWYNDFNKYAVQTYNKNFSTNYVATDIRTVDAELIPEHDILCGGFPCQAFSIAGKRKGFDDTRGTLFFEIARIIKTKRPKIVFLENVKGLLNHDQGNTFRVIIQTLSELGYDVQWMVLNSKFFGVPQNRERVFIIGNLRGQSRPEILPFRKDATTIRRICEEKMSMNTFDVARCLDSNMHKGVNPKGYFEKARKNVIVQSSFRSHRANEIREHKGSPTLTSNMGTGGNKVPMVMDYRTDEGFRIRKKASPSLRANGNFGSGNSPMIIAMRGRDNGQNFEKNIISNSLTSVQKDNFVFSGQLRRLTPVECERLQGFPDKWTEGVSDTQRYTQLGNSVTVNVITAIGKKIKQSMEARNEVSLL